MWRRPSGIRQLLCFICTQTITADIVNRLHYLRRPVQCIISVKPARSDLLLVNSNSAFQPTERTACDYACISETYAYVTSFFHARVQIELRVEARNKPRTARHDTENGAVIGTLTGRVLSIVMFETTLCLSAAARPATRLTQCSNNATGKLRRAGVARARRLLAIPRSKCVISAEAVSMGTGRRRRGDRVPV